MANKAQPNPYTDSIYSLALQALKEMDQDYTDSYTVNDLEVSVLEMPEHMQGNTSDIMEEVSSDCSEKLYTPRVILKGKKLTAYERNEICRIASDYTGYILDHNNMQTLIKKMFGAKNLKQAHYIVRSVFNQGYTVSAIRRVVGILYRKTWAVDLEYLVSTIMYILLTGGSE